MAFQLRDYQHHAIAELRRTIGQNLQSGIPSRPLMQAPTGAGKTIIAQAITNRAVAKNSRVIFTAPAIELIDQTVQKFYNGGITDIGVIQAKHPMTNPSRMVQVCSVQTLMRREIPQAGLVIIDEAHQDFKFITEWMNDPAWQDVPFVGMSATPWTKGLGNKYNKLIVVTTIGELIEKGYLSNFRVFAPSKPDLDKVRVVRGDYMEAEASAVMQDRTLIADVVKTWKEKAADRPTLCFAVDRAHARALANAFKEAGVRCGYVDAFTKPAERDALRWSFENKRIDVVCNVGVLTTGVDWDVRCIILARPTKSEMLFVQMVGRGLRTADGKDHCIILDHADTHARLGMVTDIHYTELDKSQKGERKKAEAELRKLPKECPSCHYMKLPGVHECPNCGFAPERQTDVKTEGGDLEEFVGGGSSRKKEATTEEKQSWYSQLWYIADERSYSKGWVAHQYKARFGVWPHCLYNDRKPATRTVRDFVISRQIAYAKAMEKAKAVQTGT